MVAVVIVTFGRFALTQQTLDTLLASGYDPNKVVVVVVDNGSQPEMITMLESYRDRLFHLELLNTNRGKPFALNLGANIALARVPNAVDYFLFCDNDLAFKPGWYEVMTSTYAEHKDLPLCTLSGMRWPSHPLKGVVKGATTSINVVRFPPGCCLMMSAQAFHANGKWDDRRLIRTVDTCYFRNAQRHGYKNASVHPHSVIEHTGSKQRSWHIATGEPKLLT